MMKSVCLDRKDYLFCGSEQAAKNTSLVYSIIKDYKMNGLRPVKYIAILLVLADTSLSLYVLDYESSFMFYGYSGCGLYRISQD